MRGKREYPRRHGHWVGAAVVLLLAAVLLPKSSQGAEPQSVSTAAAAAPSLAEEKTKTYKPIPISPAPIETPEETALEEPAPEEPECPVAETAAVENSYFANTVFLGDSRTEAFRLYSGLQEGIYFSATGATVESVFTRAVETEGGKMPLLDAVAQTEQSVDFIYVMLGVNELGWSDANNYTLWYGQLIDRLRQDHPEAEIVLQTNLPVSRKQDEKNTYVNNQRINVYNELLYALAEEKNCPLVDSAAAVSDEEGYLRSDWTGDGIHPNVSGCKAWLEYLRTHTTGAQTEALSEEDV